MSSDIGRCVYKNKSHDKNELSQISYVSWSDYLTIHHMRCKSLHDGSVVVSRLEVL